MVEVALLLVWLCYWWHLLSKPKHAAGLACVIPRIYARAFESESISPRHFFFNWNAGERRLRNPDNRMRWAV